jgi:hypothetical protein
MVLRIDKMRKKNAVCHEIIKEEKAAGNKIFQERSFYINDGINP